MKLKNDKNNNKYTGSYIQSMLENEIANCILLREIYIHLNSLNFKLKILKIKQNRIKYPHDKQIPQANIIIVSFLMNFQGRSAKMKQPQP